MRAFLSFFVALLVSLTASAQSFPPTPRVLLAVNPLTNKIYAVNESANSVTVLDAANNTAKTITVGSRPQFIAVNPLTNRIYVNNGGEASVSVIDGSTDTNITPTPLQVGSQGPMAINAETNVVYIVRMTSLATDEVTFLNGNDNTWYTIATESFQPTALTINPITNTLYVAHYGTGDVRVISGVYNNTVLHPSTLSIPAWSHPFAIAANPANNQVYVITEDSRGPIGIINGDTNAANWPAVSAGHASSPKALAVNPVSGKVYALFAGEVVVINGSSLSYVPVATSSSQAGIAVNPITNKIYVSSDSGSLTVIDGTTNATSTIAIPAGAESVAVNPVTNEAIVHGPTTTFVDGATQPDEGSFIQTAITPLPGNTSGPNPTFTLRATNAMNSLPVRGIYYQLDSREGAWGAAISAGAGAYTASFSGLAAGSHTLNAFAVQAEVAPIATGPESMPIVGLIASYAFTVTAGGTTPTVSLMSSSNPSTIGQAVTFTASVTGSSGTPTGTVTFTDGGTPFCSALTLASGSATCTTSALGAGNHTIAANYSGDSSYGTASGSLTETINLRDASISGSASPNPAAEGQTVTLTAILTGSAGTPTGTVDFVEGTTPLAGCTRRSVSVDRATCTTSSLSAGTHTIVAKYSGGGPYNPANSSPFSVTINALAPAKSEITSPTPGSTLTSSAVTFSWTAGGQVAERYLMVGTTMGGSQVYAGYQGNATSRTVNGIPQDGSIVYVRLMSYLNGMWQTADYSYSGGTGTPPPPAPPAKSTITSPANGSTLTSSTVTFTWDAGSQVAERYLLVGTTLGGSQVFAGYQGGATSRTVSGIPQDGSTVYVRLMSYINGMWESADYSYMGGSGTPPPPAEPAASEMASPQAGSRFTGSTVTFTWTAGNAVAERYFIVGSNLGGSDIYGGYQGSATSHSITGMPVDGRTIYVRLMSWVNGGWRAFDYTYFAAP